MAFCSQMQGTVLVDAQGNALRRPMNYLDQKGVREYRDCIGRGLIKVSGCSLDKLVRNLIVNYAGSDFATFLYDTRKGKEGWNKGLLKMYQVNPEHMPEIIDCTDLAGRLTEKAAAELGLV